MEARSNIREKMPEEVGFQVEENSRTGSATGRDASPDSVIDTLDESNFSLFSSASASVDRCSFASDAHSLASSDISHQLGGPDGGGNNSDNYQESSGSGPDHHHHHRHHRDSSHPNKAIISTAHGNTHKHLRSHHQSSRPSRDSHKAKALKEDKDRSNRDVLSITSTTSTTSSFIEDDISHHLLVDSARNSFSQALKECQERRSRSEAVSFPAKLDRHSPASLDLNNAALSAETAPAPSSPGFRSSMKKGSSVASRTSAGGNFPSPGTPNYHRVMTTNKGWSSEGVPPSSNTATNGRRQSGGGPQPYFPNSNSNGRTLPSKWEDAERWIFSPGNNSLVAGQQPGAPGVRRPKSKSGPLGPPGFAYHYSLYSPVGVGSVPAFEAGNGNAGGAFIAGPSPFSAGVTGTGGGGGGTGSNGHHHHVGLGVAFPARNEVCMARSVSIHGCSEMVPLQSFNSQDEKLDGFKNAATDICRAVSRRDMATQMSPEGSGHSSPCGRLSFSAATPSTLPIAELELQSTRSSKCDVRDVEVDERVTVTRWSKRHRGCNRKKSSEIVDGWTKKTSDSRSSDWDVSEAAKSISKSKREEAEINAWENLQKAKAEAAIRKLEMKLEKKRSSSMDKIMNKLRSAQKRAQEMRSSVLANQAQQVSRASSNALSFHRTRQMGSLSGCFTCHAF